MTRRSNFEYHQKYSHDAQAVPKITVFFLQASRSIRTVWLLEELGIPYQIEFANRVQQKAPQDFKDKSGNPLGKFPTITDGDLTIYESGAISDYLCQKYDTRRRLMPENLYLRARTQMFVHAAEATIMLHALAILYARWNLPEEITSNQGAVDKLEEGMSVNVHKDLDWLEKEIDASTGLFLVGNEITAADCMMQLSARFVLERQLGTKGKTWPKIEEWLQRCEKTDTYKRAVEKSGHTLYPETT